MAFNDGGPAFARTLLYNDEAGAINAMSYSIMAGMSLWDFYAAMDLPVSKDGDWLGWFDGKTIVEAFEKLPGSATAIDKLKWLAMVEANIRALRADAMIAEREKRRGNTGS